MFKGIAPPSQFPATVASGTPPGNATLPPPCANTGQVLVPGPKVRKHGVPVFGQARVSVRHLLRNTSCRHRGTGHAQVKEAAREPHPRVKVIVWGRRHAPEVHDALVHARCDPKLEQAQTHCLCTWYVTGCPVAKRELFMTMKECPTDRHTPQRTRAHGIIAVATLCHPY